MQADGFRAFSNTIQGKKSADDGKKRWKTMTHRLKNKDIDPLLENIGDASVKFFHQRSFNDWYLHAGSAHLLYQMLFGTVRKGVHGSFQELYSLLCIQVLNTLARLPPL
ncbi:MAG: hypothetical protein ACJ70O_03630 [Nitrososphaera sp.]